MTQYVETFHQLSGLFYEFDVVSRPFLTERYGAGKTYLDASYGSSPTHGANDGFGQRHLTIWSDPLVSSKTAALSITRVPSFADGSVAASFMSVNGSLALPALYLRASGAAGTETAYVAIFYGSYVGIYKVVAGAWTLITTSAATDYSAYNSSAFGVAQLFFNAMFQVVGTALKAKFWPLSLPEPTAWNLETTDASIAAAGWAGAGFGSNTTAATNHITRCGYISVSDLGTQRPYIPINHVTRRMYLEESSGAAVVLFEPNVLASPDSGVTGVEAMVPLSNFPFTTKPGDRPASTAYDGLIKVIGDFSQAMNDSLLGRSTQGFGDVTVVNEDGKLDDWVRWNWAGRGSRVLVGAPGWRYCDFMVTARGTVERVEAASSGTLVFKLRDSSNVLARKLTPRALIGGTGPEAAKPRPITIGYVFNVTPVLEDDTAHQYRFSDDLQGNALGWGGAPLVDTGPRENGVSILASATMGAPGVFTLTASPAGAVTLSAVGPSNQEIYGTVQEAVGGHGTIWNYLAHLYSELPEELIVGNGGRFLQGASEYAGIYISHNEEPNVDELLDKVTESVAGYWYWNLWGELACGLLDLTTEYGELEVNPYIGGSTPFSAITLEADDMTGRVLRPVKLLAPAEYGRKVLYAKNYTVQDPGTIAGSVTEPNRVRFSSEGTVQAVPSGETAGLDNPSQHSLSRQRPQWDTLWASYSSVIAERDRDNWDRAVGIFQFSTRKHAMDIQIGNYIDFTHPNYGFASGARGTVVRVSKNFRSRRATVDIAVRLSGLWPYATSTYPVVGEGDFE